VTSRTLPAFLASAAFCLSCATAQDGKNLPNEPEKISPSRPLPETTSPVPLAPGDKKGAVNSLSDSQLEQTIQTLKEKFVTPSAVTDKEMLRAKLDGLLLRLGNGASLEVGAPAEQKKIPHRFLAEVIDGRAVYIRLGEVNADSLPQIDAVLLGLTEKKISAVILDLRSVPYTQDFETAAEIARRFSPKGKVLFRLEKPSAKQERIFTANQDPIVSGVLVVLTDSKTAGAAEVVASVLRASAGALIIGSPTAGQPVEFASFSLGDGVNLQVAVAEAVSADNRKAFPNGVQPDLLLALPEEELEEIFRASAESGVGDFVFEKEQPRMNEAALISNLNPELEAASPNGEQKKIHLIDKVLQRAVDIVTAMKFLQK